MVEADIKSGKARYNSKEKRNLMVTANQAIRHVVKICPRLKNCGAAI